MQTISMTDSLSEKNLTCRNILQKEYKIKQWYKILSFEVLIAERDLCLHYVLLKLIN